MKIKTLLLTLLILSINTFCTTNKSKDRILIVLPTNTTFENGDEAPGFSLPSLLEIYSALNKSNIAIDIATTKGGELQVDENNLKEIENYGAVASLYNSLQLSEKLKSTHSIEDVNALSYKAVICLGNLPSIKEFSNNKELHDVIKKVYENDGVVASMDNAVSAIMNVKLSNGDFLVKGKKITSFSQYEMIMGLGYKNRDSLLKLIPTIPEDIIKKNGGIFQDSISRFRRVVSDQRVITSSYDRMSSSEFVKQVLEKVTKPKKKILIVVTSNDQLLDGSPAGFFLPEVTDYHYILSNAGDFKFDIASPKGGKSPMYNELGFLNDQAYQKYLLDTGLLVKLYNTLPLSTINPEDYVAIHFAGGFASLTDFPNDENLKKVARDIYEQQGIVSAVCHGPSALLNIKLSNGKYLLDGLKVTSRTVEEETAFGMFTKEQILERFPIMLEDEIKKQKAIFTSGESTEGYIESDSRVITGQGVPSTTPLAKEVLKQLIASNMTSENTEIN